MTRHLLKTTAIIAIIAALCALTSGTVRAADSAAPVKITVALPVNICLANWPFYLAQDQGLFAQQGLSVTMEGLDGSSAALQALIAGQAQVAASAPADLLAASGKGAGLIGFYSFYQHLPFALVTPADSAIRSLADLDGKTIGISNPGGGDAIFLRSLMSNAAIPDTAYEALAVGEGNSAAAALGKGVIDAFSASFVDEIVFSGMGVAYKTLKNEGYPTTTGELLAMDSGYFAAHPQVVAGLGRGLAQATRAGLADRTLVIAVCGKVAPQETEDAAFATAVLDGVDPLFSPATGTHGHYGAIDPAQWAAYRALMIKAEIARPTAAQTEVSNQFVTAWNED